MTSRPIIPPISLAATFTFESAADMARAVREQDASLYSRWSNPTNDATEAAIRDLEGAEWSYTSSSGMGAIHLGLMAAWHHQRGPVLVQTEVYGGTHELVETHLPHLGLDIRRASIDSLVSTAASLPDNAVIHLEIPANPTLRVVDIEAVRAAAPRAVIVVDATFASPLLFRGLSRGADVVVHSATKYLGGHHDVLAGVLSGNGPVGTVVWELRKLFGCCLDPSASHRLWRGLQTLELRVTQQNETAWRLAQRLDAHAGVGRVHYPRLPSHSDSQVASRIMPAGVGGVIAVELKGGYSAAERVIDGLERFHIAASLGGTCSLVTWPAGVTHAGLTHEQRRAAGIEDGLIRLAIGLESPDELWADLSQALNACRSSG